MAIGATFPAAPMAGDTHTFAGAEYTYDATLKKWVAAGSGGGGASVSVQDEEPDDPNLGDLWFYTGGPAPAMNTPELLVYVIDAGEMDGQWVSATPSGSTGDSLQVEDLVTGDLTVTGALEAAEAAIQRLFFVDATGGTLTLNQQLQVGDLVVGADANPVSGSGLLAVGSDGQTGDPANTAGGTTVGDFAVGATDQFLSWDTSAGELTIQGEIINLSTQIRDGLSGTWSIIQESWNSTNQAEATLEGAGRYRFVLIGGGGSGTVGGGANGSTLTGKGGGSGGYCAFDFEWDGISQISMIIGNGGVSQTIGTAQGANGNATSFYQSVSGTLLGFSAAGGAGGGRVFANNGLRYTNTGNLDTDDSNTAGGSGGGGFAWTGNIEQFTQNNVIPQPGFFDNVWAGRNFDHGFDIGTLVFRQGGRGGESNTSGAGASSGSAGGGGTVPFWQATNLRNGTGNNELAFAGCRAAGGTTAGSGGSLWGRVLNTGNVPNSTTRHSVPATQFQQQQIGVNNFTEVTSAGVEQDFGPFFGFYGAGTATSAFLSNNLSGNATATNTGFGVGGATAWHNFQAQSPVVVRAGPGGILAGGGGCTARTSSSGFTIAGGNGNTGGGGGGCSVSNVANNTVVSGAGGLGAIYWLKY